MDNEPPNELSNRILHSAARTRAFLAGEAFTTIVIVIYGRPPAALPGGAPAPPSPLRFGPMRREIASSLGDRDVRRILTWPIRRTRHVYALPPGGGVLSVAALICAVLVMAALALWPLVVFPVPGQQDYPNHLARAFVLLHPDDPVLSRHYRIVWDLLPNLGFDVWMIAVGRLVDPLVAGRLFQAATMIGTIAGVFALSAALSRRLTALPLLAVPLLFNTGFAMGFLGFNLSMAIMSFACAWWVWAERFHPALRLAGGTLACTVLYFCHLAGFGGYGIWVVGDRLRGHFTAPVRPPWTRLLAGLAHDAAQTIPVLVLVAVRASGATGAGTGTDATIDKFHDPIFRLGQIERLIDLGRPGLGPVVLAVLIVCVLAAGIMGWLRVSSRALPAILGCTFLFFVLPDDIWGTHYVSWRACLAAALFLVAGYEPTVRATPRRILALLSVTALAVAVAATATAVNWSRTDAARRDLLAAIAPVADGDRILYVQTDRRQSRLERLHRSGTYHLGALAVIEKRALVQSMFVKAGQQPLRFREPLYQDAPEASANPIDAIRFNFARADADLLAYLDGFDWIVGQGTTDARDLDGLPDRRMTLVSSFGETRLFRLAHREPAKEEGNSAPR